jgi:hypothetical protein
MLYYKCNGDKMIYLLTLLFIGCGEEKKDTAQKTEQSVTEDSSTAE